MINIILKAPSEFRAGSGIVMFREELIKATSTYPEDKVCLDLSDVVFMDSFSFRLVFDFMPKLPKIIPPRSLHVIESYNDWLNGKKGLCKNWGGSYE